HFLDTEYDKAKKAHDKTSGLKEHESHNDHDSFEDKKLHAKENSDHHKTHTGGSVATGSDTETAAIIDDHVRSPHYSPPYGVHYKKQPHVAHDGHHLKEDSHALKEDAESSRLHHSEESKGHREHNSERNLHKEENDKGYLDKDKGRRKEGYRERGYKITAEREYFLNDAHHDKGSSTHTSGSKLKDQEGTAHGSKEGERDRGFTKEEKIEEAHDAAYDAKNRHYYDGEQHKEDFSSGKTSSSSSGQKTQKEELVPLAPPAVNYVEAQPHPLPIFPLPIAYSPSNDGAKAVVAYPPDNLNLGKKLANDYQSPITNSRQARNGRPSVSDLRKQEPIGGYDDDYDQPEKNGYVGHASYKKRNPSPLIASIRDSVRKDVHAKPPSYSKSKSTSSEENSVRFPAEESEKHKYSEERDTEEESEEVVFPQDDKQYKGDNRDRGNEDSYQLTPKPPTLIDLRKEHRHTAEKDRSYPEVPNQTRYHQNDNVHHKQYPQLQNTRDAQRYYEQIQPDVREVQHPDKLLRTVDLNAYSNIQSGKVPTNGHLSHDVLRYSQPQINQPYADVQRRNRNNNQALYPDIQSFYNLGNQGPFGQRQLRVEKQPQNSLNVQQDPRTSRINQLLQTTQQQPIGRINQLIHNTQQQNPRPLTSVEQLPRAMSPLEQLQQLQARVTAQQQNNQRGLTLTQQHQNTQRGVTPLEQLQQQTKPPFSPVVLLSRGPPSQTQNHAVDVWYTRQQS
ncbi:uncharacterized protein LOC118199309, partial [Stegodyphus dumicola]|uniref:uncharacterized protein LOC118199309 n=1 Tax=Stegodyphus dumicola TaxID=202533 RepID=UPI0015ABE5F9